MRHTENVEHVEAKNNTLHDNKFNKSIRGIFKTQSNICNGAIFKNS